MAFARALRCAAAGALLLLPRVVAGLQAGTATIESFDPAIRGAWGPVFDFPAVAVHAHLLPTGRVFFWSRDNVMGNGAAPTWLWDPASGEFAPGPPSPAGHDPFCSGHAFLADGRLLVAGGHMGDSFGQANAALFDPWLESWEALPPMSAGRWYPSVATMANGELLVVAGSTEIGAPNALPELFRPATADWRPLPGAARPLPYYPFLFPGPSGDAFIAGPEPLSSRIGLDDDGSWEFLVPTFAGPRDYGSAVAWGDGRILVVGGGSPPVATSELIDLTAAAPTFVLVEPMESARRQLNLTLLPDGRALAVGGTNFPGFNDSRGSVLAAEIWDPETRQWTTMASMAVRRIYHSVALLLPDGSVLVAGGGKPSDLPNGDPDHPDGQIFRPPYFFRTPRPEILGAPTSVRLGQSFPLVAASLPPIVRATWLRLGSVTHAFDMNQRFVELSFRPTAEGGVAIAPSRPELAPPGHYLMFGLDSEGIPSHGRIVRLEPGIFGDGFDIGSTVAWSTTSGEAGGTLGAARAAGSPPRPAAPAPRR
jgi:hypothetical protein